MKKILITGGSGLVGSRVTELLLEKGYPKIKVGQKHHWSTKEIFAKTSGGSRNCLPLHCFQKR